MQCVTICLATAQTLECGCAVLKGIEEHKAKGFKPHEVQEKARTLADEHLRVKLLAVQLR